LGIGSEILSHLESVTSAARTVGELPPENQRSPRHFGESAKPHPAFRFGRPSRFLLLHRKATTAVKALEEISSVGNPWVGLDRTRSKNFDSPRRINLREAERLKGSPDLASFGDWA
jgi:hypothetical protein